MILFTGFVCGVFLIFYSCLAFTFHSKVLFKNKLIALQLKNGAGPEKRQRVVNIDDLGSLFGPGGIKFNSKEDEDNLNDELDAELDEKSELVIQKDLYVNSDTRKEDIVETRSTEEISSSALPDTISSIKYDEFGYGNLDKVLDKKTRLSILDSMSLSSDDEDYQSEAPRVFQYDPMEGSKPDPMLYGAYRRWKLVEEDVKAAKGKKKGGKSSSPDPKKKKGSTTNNFYDAIKNLGSGPVPKGTASTTGLTEPPPNKKPVQMQKGLPKKNKKKIITPDEINSLFSKNKGASDAQNNLKLSSQDDRDVEDDATDQDDYDDDDDEDLRKNEKQGESINDTKKQTQLAPSSQAQAFFNPMVAANEPIPKWLVDAEKEAQQKRKNLKKRRRKKITDDWRFWAALVAGAGFASAFYSIYTQTGGFDGGGLGGLGGGAFGGGGGSDELII